MITPAAVVLLALMQATPVDVPKAYDPCLAAGVRETVVFLGTRQIPPGEKLPKLVFFGTGFLVNVDGLSYLFTAGHVVTDFLNERPAGAPFLAAANLKAGPMVIQSFDDLPKQHGVGWVFDGAADIAATPFPTAPEYRVRTIPLEFFLADEQLSELQDVFFVSFQPGLEAPDKVRPILRRGMIALVDGSEVHLDAFVFPGNSGSPVFVRSEAISSSPQGAVIGGNSLSCKVIGLVESYLPYQEYAISTKTKRPRVVFEENSGLAHIVSAGQIRHFIASEEFQAQHVRLLKRERPQ